MGRRTYRRHGYKKQKGGRVPTTDEWGLHLYADMKHDFGSTVGQYYNVGGNLDAALTTALSTVPGDEKMEPRMNRYFMNILKEGDQPKANLLDNPLRFYGFSESAMFYRQLFPTLYPRDVVAVGYDAGTFITRQLEAKHFVSFGNILDPANTTVREYSNPIWCNYPDPITIDLTEYGFDRGTDGDINNPRARSITVRNLQVVIGAQKEREGDEVFRIPSLKSQVFIDFNGTDWDAVKRRGPPGAAIGYKILNDYDPATAGFFTSISEAGVEDIGIKVRSQIGKTIGDTAQVAALNPELYPREPGRWKRFNFGAAAAANANIGDAAPTIDLVADEIPTKFVLKTGDILNHTRAIMKGVPSIYESPATKTRKKEFIFIPSELQYTNNDYLNALFQKIETDIGQNFDSLIGELTRLDERIVFVRRSGSVFSNAEMFTAFLGKIEVAIVELQTLRDDLIGLTQCIRSLRGTPEEIFALYQVYLEYARCRTPTTTQLRSNTGIVVRQAHIASVPGVVIPIQDMITDDAIFDRLFVTPINQLIVEVANRTTTFCTIVGIPVTAAGAAAELRKGIERVRAPVGPGDGVGGIKRTRTDDSDGAESQTMLDTRVPKTTRAAEAEAEAEAAAAAEAAGAGPIEVQRLENKEKPLKGGASNAEYYGRITVTLLKDEPKVIDALRYLPTVLDYQEYTGFDTTTLIKHLHCLMRHFQLEKQNGKDFYVIEDMIVLERMISEFMFLNKLYEIRDEKVPRPIQSEQTAITDKFNAFVYWLIETSLDNPIDPVTEFYKNRKESYEAGGEDGAPGAGVAAAPAGGPPAPAGMEDGAAAVAAPAGGPPAPAEGSEPSSGYTSTSELSQFPAVSPPKGDAKGSEPGTAQGSQAQSSDDEREGAVPGLAKTLSLFSPPKPGGLRTPRRSKSNARRTRTRTFRSAKHSRLRKRTGARRTRRVR